MERAGRQVAGCKPLHFMVTNSASGSVPHRMARGQSPESRGRQGFWR